MADQPKTMKAWIVAKNGEPKDAGVLQLKTDYPFPAPPTGTEILIKISHAALNPVDVHLALNIPVWLPFRRNPIPAFDFTGEIVAAGPSVPAEFSIGTEVCAALTVSQVFRGKGAIAEYVKVPADSVAVKPKSLSAAAASGLMGIAGQTAAIMEKDAKLKKGDRVLINGASGGVGNIILQIAKAKGATVTGICSGVNIPLVESLGADEVVDYKAHDSLETFLAEKNGSDKFDCIYDTAGSQSLYSQSAKYLKDGGIFITIVGGRTQGIVPYVRNKLIPTFLGGTPRAFHILGLTPSGALAKEVADMADSGAIKEALIDSEYSFEDVPKAYEKLQTKRAKGKIVVKVSA